MPKQKFEIGDRVEYVPAPGAAGSHVLDGERGTVIFMDGTEAGVTVRFDRPVPYAVSETRASSRPIGNCWFCKPSNLRKLRGRKRRDPAPVSDPDLIPVAPIPTPEPEPIPVAPIPAPEPEPIPVAPIPAPEPEPIPAADPKPAPERVIMPYWLL